MKLIIQLVRVTELLSHQQNALRNRISHSFLRKGVANTTNQDSTAGAVWVEKCSPPA